LGVGVGVGFGVGVGVGVGVGATAIVQWTQTSIAGYQVTMIQSFGSDLNLNIRVST